MSSRPTDGSALLEMEFTPDWSFINDVRSFVETFCERGRVPIERASAVALTVHELLQNAIDYSTDGRAKLRLLLDASAQSITLSVSSHGNPEKVEGLRQLMQRLEQEPDPLKLYLALMKETAKKKGGSGLGLARIRFEGGMDLKIEVEEGVVRVTASSTMDPPTPLVQQLRGPRKESHNG